MSLYLDLIPKARAKGNKIVGQCPACSEMGGDSRGVHLVIMPGGAYGCAAHQQDRQHNRRIRELIGLRSTRYHFGSECLKSAPKPKRVDLLARIKSDYSSSLGDLWDASPVQCDESLNDDKAFLRLFPSDAVLWIAPDIYCTGEPRQGIYWRTRAEWELQTFTEPGTRIASATFKPGCYSRCEENVTTRPFVVIESDLIGIGMKYRNHDEFCALIRWLHQACHWNLAAVVDTGGKSLHAWFRWPGVADIAQLAEYAEELGLDGQFRVASHPWRLPGVMREQSDRRQQLFYLDLWEGA